MVERLKVDQTIIDAGNKFILISNINIPKRFINRPDQNETFSRIENFINETYSTLDTIWFEISATYQLVHRESGTPRDWVGSFNPRFGPLLHETCIFDANFKNILNRILILPEVEQKLLQFNNVASDWVFDTLYSIIIHISGFIPKDFPIVYMRGLLSNHGKGRRVATYDLP